MWRVIWFIILLGASASLAIAQPYQNETPNRLACFTVKALKAHIKALPSSQAIRTASNNPNTDGCIWLDGTSPIPLGPPHGWLYSTDYLFLVHSISLSDGRAALHPSVVVEWRRWRLDDDCRNLRRFLKTYLPNGEKSSFYGVKNESGFDNSCLSMIDREREYVELNAQPVRYSANWVSRPPQRHNNACTTVFGLVSGLDAVVNEQQIRFSSTDVFSYKRGCFQRDIAEIVVSRFLGLYLSNEKTDRKRFWFEIHQVGYSTPGTQELSFAYMPTNPAQEKFLRVSQNCLANTTSFEDAGSALLRGSTQGTVESAQVRPQGRFLRIDQMFNAPIGLNDCHIGNVFSG